MEQPSGEAIAAADERQGGRFRVLAVILDGYAEAKAVPEPEAREHVTRARDRAGHAVDGVVVVGDRLDEHGGQPPEPADLLTPGSVGDAELVALGPAHVHALADAPHDDGIAGRALSSERKPPDVVQEPCGEGGCAFFVVGTHRLREERRTEHVPPQLAGIEAGVGDRDEGRAHRHQRRRSSSGVDAQADHGGFH